MKSKVTYELRADLKELIEAGHSKHSVELPRLAGGSAQQKNIARFIRDLSIARLLAALAERPGEERPSPSAFGKLFRWGIEQTPCIAPLIEIVRTTTDARWWLDVAYGPKGQIDDAPFYVLTSALKSGHDELLEQLVQPLVSKACDHCRDEIDRGLSVIEQEARLVTQIQIKPLPKLTGTERQITWARKLRIKAIQCGMPVTEVRTRQRCNARWWIKNREEIPTSTQELTE